MSDRKLPVISDAPWYAEGLSFECTGCGQCCTGAPGFVFVTEKEIVAIARHLGLSVREFSRRFLRKIGDRFSLKEYKNYDCVFLKDNKCSIYTCRPVQCRTFPFWPRILASKEAWDETATQCEGMRPGARKVALDEIEAQRKKQEDNEP